ncbi:PSD1 and planctomycete cytochrome C domain-containing protein [Bremerella cremea]|nr:PSD1 and planctomycete cytochrome C domain-containing protein [Bremerella cremea]
MPMVLFHARPYLALVAVASLLATWTSTALAENSSSDRPQFTDSQLEFFEKHVRPILVQRCYECHGPEAEAPGGGLYLTSRSAILEGGDSGPSVVPGKADESQLIEAIHYDGIYQMPPKSRMPDVEIAKLEQWVNSGAAWPIEDEANTPKKQVFDLAQRQSEHWAWQPVRRPEIPSVQEEAWAKDPLDYFILAKLEAASLTPNQPAERTTLLRRVYFDLIGLPPTPQQVEAFLQDDSPDALAKVVDQLLASPRFGEHWGRHWLDLVRYAESRGHEFDYDIPNAFEYRDYVIRALNQDVPYNKLVIEHIAGDLVEQPRMNADQGFNEAVLGTGFWHMGDWVHSPVDIRKDEADRFDNMLDVMNKAFLGLTVTCARCHDHKFDAISQADYYAQMGFLQSSSYRQVRFETQDHNAKIAAALAKLEEETNAQAASLLSTQFDEATSTIEADLAAGKSEWSELLAEAQADPQHPLYWWSRYLAATPESRTAEVATAQARVSAEQEAIANANVQIVNDFARLPQEEWRTDGFVFGATPRQAGQIEWSAAKPSVRRESAAVFDLRWAPLKLQEGVQDDFGRIHNWNRAGRTLKSNSFPLQDGRVHYLVQGAGRAFAVVDSHRLVNGPLHGVVTMEWNVPVEEGPRWITHNLRDYRGHATHIEFSPIDDKPMEVLLVVEGDKAPPTLSAEAEVAAAFVQAIAGKTDQPASETLVDAMHTALATSNDPRLKDWLLKHWETIVPGQKAPLEDLANTYQQKSQELLSQVRWQSRTAPGMWDNSAEQEHLLIRGNVRNPSEPVERRLLTVLEKSPTQFDPHGSGRLQLAHQMMAPDNPFASRVAVNRIWHYLMGRGIVRTVDNFGVLGEEPTHPELLDYLASEFVDNGWSLKQMIRRVVLSQTYQMSSVQIDPAETADPKNDLFHRAQVKRLGGEAIRDSLLMVGGNLDETMYGPSVKIYLTSFMQGRGRPGASGPLDGAGRRSVYLEIRRNFLSPMMLAFDTPQPITTIGRRNQSNVPAQSLILLNDPFVLKQCELWAQRAIAETPDDAQLRFQRMVEQAFSRQPTDAERALADEFLTSHMQTLQIDPQQRLVSVELWRDLAHVLVNAKPFIFVR